MNRIRISDITMKQTGRDLSLSFKEKIELSKLLDKLGVSVIELEPIVQAKIDSLRIKSEGLEWPTDGVVFDNWWKATLNRASQDKVRLEFSHRSIALIMLN